MAPNAKLIDANLAGEDYVPNVQMLLKDIKNRLHAGEPDSATRFQSRRERRASVAGDTAFTTETQSHRG